jgi:hypothetical protein
MTYKSLVHIISLTLLTSLVACNPNTDFSAKNPQSSFYESDTPNSANTEVLDNGGDVAQEDAGDNGDENTEEVSEPQEQVLKACKVDVRFTSIGQNAKITVISGPMNKIIQDFSKVEFSSLSSEDKNFLQNALNDNLPSITAKPGHQATIQSQSQEIIVKNSELASAFFNQVNPDLRLALLLEGKNVSVKGTSLKANSKVLAVLKGSESASLSFTSIHENTEIFIFAPTSAANTTCVSATGIINNIRLSSYVYSDGISAAQGFIKATGVKSDGQLNHHVIGGDNSLAVFEATSIEKLTSNILVQGGHNTQSRFKFTSLKEDNIFKVKMIGKDYTSLALKGTSAGQRSVLDLDMIGEKNVSAGVKFTSNNDFLVKGKISAKENPSLNFSGDSEVLLLNIP